MNLVSEPVRGGQDRTDWWLWSSVYQCPTCRGCSLLTVSTTGSDGSGERRFVECLPFGTAKPLEPLPDDVGSDREEAWSAFHGGLHKGAALLARSSLESAVKQLGASGKDLYAKVDSLADSGVITKDLAAWAHEVRLTGNEAAHEMGPVSEADAQDGLYFLDAFLEAVYVVPARHRERVAQREAAAQHDDSG